MSKHSTPKKDPKLAIENRPVVDMEFFGKLNQSGGTEARTFFSEAFKSAKSDETIADKETVSALKGEYSSRLRGRVKELTYGKKDAENPAMGVLDRMKNASSSDALLNERSRALNLGLIRRNADGKYEPVPEYAQAGEAILKVFQRKIVKLKKARAKESLSPKAMEAFRQQPDVFIWSSPYNKNVKGRKIKFAYQIEAEGSDSMKVVKIVPIKGSMEDAKKIMQVGKTYEDGVNAPQGVMVAHKVAHMQRLQKEQASNSADEATVRLVEELPTETEQEVDDDAGQSDSQKTATA